MGSGERRVLIPKTTGRSMGSPAREWFVASIIFGLMLVVGLRQGGFWRSDAFVVALAATGLLAAAIVVTPPDRRSSMVIVSVVLLDCWWLVRTQLSGSSLTQFLPLGASFLAFAAAFAAVRALKGPARQAAGLGISCLGTAGALIGFAGLIWRWYPMAIPTQGLWRLSSTLTYSDAAGLVLGACLLVALGTDLHPWLVRISVCTCAGGLLATQSRGAYIAFACACLIVPSSRYVRQLVPLVAGAVLGGAAIASSPDKAGEPWLAVVLILAIAAALPRWKVPSFRISTRARVVLALSLLCVVGMAFTLLHHEIGLRSFSPSDQDRYVEWTAAVHQWQSAPILGVGPDRLLVFHAPDGTYAHFAHNEFLQIAADAGVIGIVLLGLSVISVIRVVRRCDALSSCATAALVCWAVAAVFDFDWHLTFVGFLGGWCLGLAAEEQPDEA